MVDFLDTLKIVGGLAGIVALIWRGFDEFGSHLRISIKVEHPANNWITALTTVENKSNRVKDIAYALLLLGPEPENPLDTARLLADACGYKGRLNSTNDFAGFKLRSAFYRGDRAIIPLTFYYSENVNIADETLTYRVPIPVADMQPGSVYSVRFFLFPARRLHRSTQDCFVVQ